MLLTCVLAQEQNRCETFSCVLAVLPVKQVISRKLVLLTFGRMSAPSGTSTVGNGSASSDAAMANPLTMPIADPPFTVDISTRLVPTSREACVNDAACRLLGTQLCLPIPDVLPRPLVNTTGRRGVFVVDTPVHIVIMLFTCVLAQEQNKCETFSCVLAVLPVKQFLSCYLLFFRPPLQTWLKCRKHIQYSPNHFPGQIMST